MTISDQAFKEAVLDVSSKLGQIVLLLEDIKKLHEPPGVLLWKALREIPAVKPGTLHK